MVTLSIFWSLFPSSACPQSPLLAVGAWYEKNIPKQSGAWEIQIRLSKIYLTIYVICLFCSTNQRFQQLTSDVRAIANALLNVFESAPKMKSVPSLPLLVAKSRWRKDVKNVGTFSGKM